MKRILLVEDSEQMGRMTARSLESNLGVTVVRTTTFEETRALLDDSANRDFFGAVLDFVLPDAPDGEIIDLVVKYGIPSIVFTASISEKIRQFVWSKKVVDYILKDDPNSLDYLADAFRRLESNAKSKILVVDDTQFFRKIISEILHIHQYKIATAPNGVEALKVLQANSDIKLVVTDYNMPQMDGFQLCREIRKTYSKGDLAIIGISTKGDADMAPKFIKSGANDFIVKQSFTREEFYCRVSQCIENIDLIHMTREAAIKDFLTGLYNRRYFFDQGKALFEKTLQDQTPMACVMMDIDHFKQVNDTHGHDAGDAVLKALSAKLTQWATPSDLVARLGGEEFCILSQPPPDQGHDPSAFFNRFDTLRKEIQAMDIDIDGPAPLQITLSMGLEFNRVQDFDQMLKQADQLLYIAKTCGRNQVKMA